MKTLVFLVGLLVFCCSATSPQVFEALQNWMRDKGTDMYTRDYQVKDFEKTGRGLASNKKIERGDLLFSVPYEIMLTTEKVKKTPVWPICREFDGISWDEQQIICLAAFLLYQKYEVTDSPWKIFIETIPTSYDTILQFDEDDLSFLTDTALYPTAMYRREFVSELWEDFQEALDVYPDVFQKKKIGQEDFLWAYTSVATRTFSIHRNDKALIAMVPLADMLNHVPESPEDFLAWTFDNITDFFVMRAIHDIPVGREIFTNYGDKGNDKLLSWYGFVTDSNAQDVIPVLLEPKFDDPLVDMKNHLIKMITKEKTLFIGRESISSELLAAGRIMIIKELEVFQDEELLEDLMNGRSIALELDYAVFNSLLKFCNKLFENYENSEEDDREMLEIEDLPYRQKISLKYRIMERKTLESAKKILKFAKDKISERISEDETKFETGEMF